MNRTQIRLIAFGLILALAAPTQVDAGIFGWLKRRKTKCRPAPVCPTPCPTGAIPMERQVLPLNTTVCHVILYGTRWDESSQQWVQCHATGMSDEGDPSGENCKAMMDQARDRAAAALPAGCMVDTVYPWCDDGSCYDYIPEYPPPMESVQKAKSPVASSGCVYKVTYQICCCDGQLIDRHICNADLSVAKHRAKILACYIANSSGCKIRWCKWKICRVPASLCK